MNSHAGAREDPFKGFTLVELLVVLAIVAVLAALGAAATSKAREASAQAACTANLRQAGVGALLYAQEHEGKLVEYSRSVPVGRLWYFGLETGSGAEGQRQLEIESGPLAPYLRSEKGLGICPAFSYTDPRWKAKFDGPSCNYGFNVFLSGKPLVSIALPSRVILFGDSAQVNTFQAPASPGNPMFEEYYEIEHRWSSIHFRHGKKAQFVFLDGHVEALPMHPGTGDMRISDAGIGRITPRWSMEYLQ